MAGLTGASDRKRCHTKRVIAPSCGLIQLIKLEKCTNCMFVDVYLEIASHEECPNELEVNAI
jgi:hypothetical protein